MLALSCWVILLKRTLELKEYHNFFLADPADLYLRTLIKMVAAVGLFGIAKIKTFLTEGDESVIHAGDNLMWPCEISSEVQSDRHIGDCGVCLDRCRRFIVGRRIDFCAPSGFMFIKGKVARGVLALYPLYPINKLP